MIPFLSIGTDQLANSRVGEPATGNREKFCGGDRTVKKKGKNIDVNALYKTNYPHTVCNVDQFHHTCTMTKNAMRITAH